MGKVVAGLLAVVLLIVILYFLFGRGLGMGNGNGDTKGDGNQKVIETQLKESINNETIKEVQSTTQEISTDEESAVAIEEKNGTKIEIIVSGNEYFYKEQNYSIEELKQIVNEIKENENDFFVYITDDMASKNAYDELVGLLEELNVVYVYEVEDK